MFIVHIVSTCAAALMLERNIAKLNWSMDSELGEAYPDAIPLSSGSNSSQNAELQFNKSVNTHLEVDILSIPLFVRKLTALRLYAMNSELMDASFFRIFRR
jgi:hypothetical protein